MARADKILGMYSEPVKSWPGEEWMDVEARANYAAANPTPLPMRPDERHRYTFLPERETVDGRSEWAVPGFLQGVWDAARAVSDSGGWGAGSFTPPSQMSRQSVDQLIGHAFEGAGAPLATTGFARAALSPRLAPGATELGIFGGRRARTANLDALQRAENMAMEGAPRESIWKDTGWFEGPDGRWRFEIDDSTASLRDGPAARKALDDMLAERREALDWVKASRAEEKIQPDLFPKLLKKDRGAELARARALKERAEGNYGLTWIPEMGRRAEYAFDHPALFEAYPTMGRHLIVRQGNADPDGARGAYHGGSDQLDIYRSPETVGPDGKVGGPGARSTGLHELQHAVQFEEDFARGGNPWMFNDIKAPIDVLDRKAIAPVIERFGDLDSAMPLPTARDYLNTLFDQAKARGASVDDLQPILQEMQRVDKFAISPFEQYKRLAGEVEARAVQARRDLTPEQRRERPPWMDYDVPENQQIPMFDAKGRAEGGRVGLFASRLGPWDTGRESSNVIDARGWEPPVPGFPMLSAPGVSGLLSHLETLASRSLSPAQGTDLLPTEMYFSARQRPR